MKTTAHAWAQIALVAVGLLLGPPLRAGLIDRTIMTATGVNTYWGTPANAINGRVFDWTGPDQNSAWYSITDGQWIRLDLGARHSITGLAYNAAGWNLRVDGIANYSIYVTDSSSDTPGDWGTADKSGTFARDTTTGIYQNVSFAAATGQYVYLQGNSRYEWQGGAGEIQLYGYSVAPVVNAFGVTDQEELGTNLFTRTTTVNVSAFDVTAGPGTSVNGYLITQSATRPAAGDPGWLAAPPATCTFTAPAGTNVTLYAWARSDQNDVSAARTATVYYEPTTPTAGGIGFAVFNYTTATAAWTSDVRCFGSVRYRGTNAVEWTTTAWEATATNTHVATLTNLVFGAYYDVEVRSGHATNTTLYRHWTTQVPRAIMTATGVNTYGGDPANAINGRVFDWTGPDMSSAWYSTTDGHWIRLDLGAQHSITGLAYNAAGWNLRVDGIANYSLYVTDSSSDTPGDWGTAVKSGTFAHDTTTGIYQNVSFAAATGRYVYLRGLSRYTWQGGAGEIQLYGYPLWTPTVNTFRISDSEGVGTNVFTRNATVTVDAFDATASGGGTIAGYLITQSATPPLASDPGWVASKPATWTFSAAAGTTVALYAWAKNDMDLVSGSRTASIYYEPTTPALASVTATPYVESEANVTWVTDVPAYGWVRYRLTNTVIWTTTAWSATALATHTQRLRALLPGNTYEVEAHSGHASQLIQYAHRNPEIPRTAITATASATGGGFLPSLAIDNLVRTGGSGQNAWLAGSVPAWIRLDLGSTYVVTNVFYWGWYWSDTNDLRYAATYDYYVTEADSGDTNTWGAVVKSGAFAAINDWQEMNPPAATGRYVILRGKSDSSGWQIGAGEVKLYGYSLATPTVNAFRITDSEGVGTNLFTRSATVTVDAFDATASGGKTLAGYLITQSATPPLPSAPGWVASKPATWTFSAAAGTTVTLYAWAKDDMDIVSAGRPASIYYESTTPTIATVTATPYVESEANVTWTTDVPALGWVRYRLTNTVTWTETAWESSPTATHTRRVRGLTPGNAYDVDIHSGHMSHTRLYPHTNPEIPRSRIVADASASGGVSYQPSMAIDNQVRTGGSGQNAWLSGSLVIPAWIRLDLGKTYVVTNVFYWGWYWSDTNDVRVITSYDCYVTESASGDTDAWGPVVKAGAFTAVHEWQELNPPAATGRYVILRGKADSTGWQIGAGEIKVFGRLPPWTLLMFK